MIAHVSQRVPLSTSTRYEAWAISNPSSCYTKVRSLFQAFFNSRDGARLLHAPLTSLCAVFLI